MRADISIWVGIVLPLTILAGAGLLKLAYWLHGRKVREVAAKLQETETQLKAATITVEHLTAKLNEQRARLRLEQAEQQARERLAEVGLYPASSASLGALPIEAIQGALTKRFDEQLAQRFRAASDALGFGIQGPTGPPGPDGFTEDAAELERERKRIAESKEFFG